MDRPDRILKKIRGVPVAVLQDVRATLRTQPGQSFGVCRAYGRGGAFGPGNLMGGGCAALFFSVTASILSLLISPALLSAA